MDNQGIKNKIISLVEGYKKIYPKDYAGVCDLVRFKKEKMINRQATGPKGFEGFDRALYDCPEILFNIFEFKLSKDEKEWLRSKDGARWFAGTYKEFMLTDKI